MDPSKLCFLTIFANSLLTSSLLTLQKRDAASDVVNLVNNLRIDNGCQAVSVDSRITLAAQGHTNDEAARNYYSHISPEGEDTGDRLDHIGYHTFTWGEVLDMSPKTAAEAVDRWMDSPTHRQIILDCKYTQTRVGVTQSASGDWYWAEAFTVS